MPGDPDLVIGASTTLQRARKKEEEHGVTGVFFFSQLFMAM